MPFNTSSDNYVPPDVTMDSENISWDRLTGNPRIIPPTNSTSAIQALKADGTTPVLNIDTTNSNVSVIGGFNATNTTAGSHGNAANLRLVASVPATGTFYNKGVFSYLHTQISSGVKDDGYKMAGHFQSLGNFIYSGDSGTLSTLCGVWVQYGHYNSTSSMPNTTTAIGVQISPYSFTGTIDSTYDLYANDTFALGNNGIIANRYGIYIDGDNKTNYFAGKLGIGTKAPDSQLTLRSETVTNNANYLTQENYTSSVRGPTYVFRKARGTASNPANLVGGDEIGTIYPIFRAHNQWSLGVSLQWLYTGDNTTSKSELRVGSALRVKSTNGVLYVPLSAAPSTPEEGEVYYDSSLKKLRCFDGSTWQNCW